MPPISFIGRRKQITRRCFTLIELVVVMVIIMISVGMVSVYIRGESPARSLDNVALEFEAFCSRVRFRAAEDGHDWVVRYMPSERMFVAERGKAVSSAPLMTNAEIPTDVEASGTSIAEVAVEEDEEDPLPPVLQWKLSDKFTLNTSSEVEDTVADGENFELFRFFSDGSAAGGARMVLRCGELARAFEMSKLTGRLIVREGTGEDDDPAAKIATGAHKVL